MKVFGCDSQAFDDDPDEVTEPLLGALEEGCAGLQQLLAYARHFSELFHTAAAPDLQAFGLSIPPRTPQRP